MHLLRKVVLVPQWLKFQAHTLLRIHISGKWMVQEVNVMAFNFY